MRTTLKLGSATALALGGMTLFLVADPDSGPISPGQLNVVAGEYPAGGTQYDGNAYIEGKLYVANRCIVGPTSGLPANVVNFAESIAVGRWNTVSSMAAAAFGVDNEVGYESFAAGGRGNKAKGYQSFVAGYLNDVQSTANWGSALGRGHTVKSESCLAVGQYSKSGTAGVWDNSDDKFAFVVGVGTTSADENAFEVTQAGTVRVTEAQGDISMGQFGP